MSIFLSTFVSSGIRLARETAGEGAKLVALARQRELRLRRISLLKASHDLFRHWHIIHLPLAQTMYITMAIHILVAIMTGYF